MTSVTAVTLGRDTRVRPRYLRASTIFCVTVRTTPMYVSAGGATTLSVGRPVTIVVTPASLASVCASDGDTPTSEKTALTPASLIVLTSPASSEGDGSLPGSGCA